ncbi:4-hydroxy-tetrahydrodipicolinate synthase [Arthrobacter sp. TE12232]
MSKKLTGVLTALVTPFGPDGQIDEAALRKIVDRSIDGGVDGVVACGSTGEFFSLSNAERRFVVETVVDQAAGRVPVVAHTGAMSTAEAIELTLHAQSVGASIAMVVAPYYEPLTLEETVEYLRDVAGSVDIPIMIYNLPVATGVNLTPDVVGKLATEVSNIQYIKDTSGDIAQAGQLIRQYSDVISTIVGWDTLMFSALSEGAAGVMLGMANAIPAELVSIYRAFSDGDLDRARQEWEVVYPLLNAILATPYAQGVKAALDALGVPTGGTRKPLCDLDPADAARIATLATALPQKSRQG